MTHSIHIVKTDVSEQVNIVMKVGRADGRKTEKDGSSRSNSKKRWQEITIMQENIWTFCNF